LKKISLNSEFFEKNQKKKKKKRKKMENPVIARYEKAGKPTCKMKQGHRSQGNI